MKLVLRQKSAFFPFHAEQTGVKLQRKDMRCVGLTSSVVFVALTALCLLAYSPPAQKPSFEVASIKPSATE
jgi:hypothetical protein